MLDVGTLKHVAVGASIDMGRNACHQRGAAFQEKAANGIPESREPGRQVMKHIIDSAVRRVYMQIERAH